MLPRDVLQTDCLSSSATTISGAVAVSRPSLSGPRLQWVICTGKDRLLSFEALASPGGWCGQAELRTTPFASPIRSEAAFERFLLPTLRQYCSEELINAPALRATIGLRAACDALDELMIVDRSGRQ